MSDSIAILSNEKIKEKQGLLRKIKVSAQELKSNCATANAEFRFFDWDDRAAIDGYIRFAEKIIDFCNYQETNHIELETLQVSDTCNEKGEDENIQF